MVVGVGYLKIIWNINGCHIWSDEVNFPFGNGYKSLQSYENEWAKAACSSAAVGGKILRRK